MSSSCISDDGTCISDRAHTHTLDAPVCSKLRTFECESAPKNRLVRCRCARPRAELPGVDARRARGCRHAASRSRRACTLPCPLLCPADIVCSLCVYNGSKKTQRFKFVSVYFCFFVYPRVNKKLYHSNSTFGNVAASKKMSEVPRSASPPRTATSSACSFRKFYPI
jgi:hypothetical protein